MVVSPINRLVNSHGRTGVVLAALGASVLLAPGASMAREVDGDLAKQAHAILVNRCGGCHGDNKPRVAGRNILDRETLIAAQRDEDPWLVPGDLEQSTMWTVIDENYMPYNAAFESQPLPDEEKATIKRWIEDGGHFPGNTPRNFITEEDVLSAIALDLFKAGDDRDHLRYFSIHHLHNNWERVSVRQLRTYRAALSKAVNSLSDEGRIVLPRALDEGQTVFAVDVQDLGWDAPLANGQTKWQRIVSAYPFGFEPFDPGAAKQFDSIRNQLRGNFDRVAYVRGDWFVATATRPPLYHDLLEIPQKLSTLEERLGVDRQGDFEKDLLLRAGVQESGVSAQNRLVDWHRMGRRNGSYWISYDFKLSSGRSNLARFPVGPEFEENPLQDFAFEHDGGEVIYRLLNGMQAYMLVDDEGNRIQAGPVEIVWDTRQVSGTPQIVNGLSCMGCHQYGTRAMVDVIGRNQAVFNKEVRAKVTDLYDHTRFQLALADDEQDFMETLEDVTGPFLLVDEDAGKDIRTFPEPIAYVALQYGRDMRLADVAYELGILPVELQGNNRVGNLQSLGLGPLFAGAAIKRSMWAAIDDQFSPFHLATRELRIGIPIAVENIESEVDSEPAE